MYNVIEHKYENKHFEFKTRNQKKMQTGFGPETRKYKI